jgi:hypothetical protein
VKVKKDRKQERSHLHPKSWMVVTLDRFRQEKQDSGNNHHQKTADQPGLGILSHLRRRLAAQPRSI